MEQLELGCNLNVVSGITLKEGTVVPVLGKFKSEGFDVIAVLYEQSGKTLVTSIDPSLLKPIGSFEQKLKSKARLDQSINNLLYRANLRGRTMTTFLTEELIDIGVVDKQKLLELFGED